MTTAVLHSVVDEALSLSDLPPYILTILSESIKSFYDENTVTAIDDPGIPEITKFLYELDDNKLYSIVSLCYQDKYTHFLLPAENVKLPFRATDIIKLAREKYNLQGKEISDFAMKLKKVSHIFNEIFSSSTRTTRRAVGNDGKEVVLPSVDELERFYKCGRKHRYESLESAAEALSGVNDAYLCSFCNGWHQGKTPTGQSIPQHVQEGRWVTAWRRYHGV